MIFYLILDVVAHLLGHKQIETSATRHKRSWQFQRTTQGTSSRGSLMTRIILFRWGVSREMLNGRSSELMTHFTKFNHSGMSSSQSSMMKNGACTTGCRCASILVREDGTREQNGILGVEDGKGPERRHSSGRGQRRGRECRHTCDLGRRKGRQR